ncbi:Hypothetical protein NGAL_HAMBI1145_23550 [Neorhizobium galegae bv. officinalis]|uniref:Uncharacterized protein n=1 Tax=Neorhizobium galegae bv. officinalis TaxID=323656 RepID=A0A0T7FHH3_NEOGA|nr:Hypothetical protein NGAL_HAMBI1145_23550 [Neorhizobium galegae bv. officinalis]
MPRRRLNLNICVAGMRAMLALWRAADGLPAIPVPVLPLQYVEMQMVLVGGVAAR